jgi:DNA mismatch repair protein PMS2
MEIWKRNGFHLLPNPNNNSSPRFVLSAIPILPQHTFGQPDLEELMNLIEESSLMDKTKIACGKLLKIFASKACRSAVMIGDKLDLKSMKTIVINMGTMIQPYNCPHGRPTMRHLMTL